MRHRPFVFLDIETTGGTPVHHRVTEIGALRVEDGVVVQRFSQLVNPEQAVPSFITRLTGISDAMLWDAPTFAAIADDLELFLDGAVFIAHNVGFDYGFLQAEYKRLGNLFSMDRLCTVRLSRALYPAQRRHNLDSVIAAHGLSVENRHRALDDAQALYDFYLSALTEHGMQTYVAMNKLLRRAPKKTKTSQKTQPLLLDESLLPGAQ